MNFFLEALAMPPLAAFAWIAVGIVLVALGVAIATAPLWILVILNTMAKNNFLVTIVEENTGKWIMKYGKAWRFVTSHRYRDPQPSNNPVTSWKLHEEEPLVTLKKSTIKKSSLSHIEGHESALRTFLDRHLPGGMRWVGLPFIYSIYQYNFRWSVLRERKPGNEEGLVDEPRQLANGKWVASFSKRLDYLYLRDAAYCYELRGAETKELMAVDLYLVSTIRVVNPYRAMFVIHDWLEATMDLIRPSVRNWVKDHNYEQVVGKPETTQRENDILLKETGEPQKSKVEVESIGQYLERAYGVRVKRIAFDDVIPPKDYATAAEKRVAAEQQKIMIATLAQGEAAKITTIAAADAERIVAIAKAEAEATKLAAKAFEEGGNPAVVARTIEALEKTHPVVMGAQPVTVLIDAVKGNAPTTAKKE